MAAPGDPGTYIGPDGNWYDGNGNVISAGATAAGPAFVPGSQGFTNTSPLANLGPNNPSLGTVSATNPTTTRINPFTGQPYTLDQLQAMNAAGGIAAGSPNAQALAAAQATQTPATPQLSKPTQTAIFGDMPAIPKAPPFYYAPFQAPAPFSAPSGQDVLTADPGFAFREGQGLQELQQSAAAQGVLNTGGTLQDIVNYGQQAGSQEYANAYNRAQGTYQTNFNDALNAWLANAGNAFQTYTTNYNTQVQNPYLAAWGQYQQGVGNQNQLFQQQFQTATA